MTPSSAPAARAPGAARLGRPRDDRADAAVLEATVELLGETGFAGTSVDAIAARAGVGKATIYRRWPSKEALVLAACGSLSAPEEVTDTGSLRTDLVALVAAFVHALRTTPVGQLMPGLMAESLQNRRLRDLRAEMAAAKREPYLAAIGRAVERGELPPDVDAELLVDLVTGPLLVRHLLTGRPLDPDLAERVVDAVLAGASAQSR